MQVKLTTSLRGPKGETREVFAKIKSRGGAIWYIIESTEGYETDDDSYIDDDEQFLYVKPEVERTPGFRYGDCPIKGRYTFIPNDHVEELRDFKNNSQAKHLLGKKY
jgi:hypothetical protein